MTETMISVKGYSRDTVKSGLFVNKLLRMSTVSWNISVAVSIAGEADEDFTYACMYVPIHPSRLWCEQYGLSG